MMKQAEKWAKASFIEFWSIKAHFLIEKTTLFDENGQTRLNEFNKLTAHRSGINAINKWKSHN